MKCGKSKRRNSAGSIASRDSSKKIRAKNRVNINNKENEGDDRSSIVIGVDLVSG